MNPISIGLKVRINPLAPQMLGRKRGYGYGCPCSQCPRHFRDGFNLRCHCNGRPGHTFRGHRNCGQTDCAWCSEGQPWPLGPRNEPATAEDAPEAHPEQAGGSISATITSAAQVRHRPLCDPPIVCLGHRAAVSSLRCGTISCESPLIAVPAGCGCKLRNSRLGPRAGAMKGVCACRMTESLIPVVHVLACHEISWRAL